MENHGVAGRWPSCDWSPPPGGAGFLAPALLATTGLLVSLPMLAEPHLLGEARACDGVVRRHHGIIAAKTPLFAILLWCEVVMGAQMSLERLEFLAVLKADDVVRSD